MDKKCNSIIQLSMSPPENDIVMIGKGGFGKVYRVFNELDRKTYAIKKILLTEESARNALNEIRVLCNVQHENIIRYFHSWIETENENSIQKITKKKKGEEDYMDGYEEEETEEMENEGVLSRNNQIFYVCLKMEYCDGSLKKYLQTRVNTVLADFYLAQIVNGLSYLHTLGIIHRDIKPDNILIYNQSLIKISDFGLVKVFSSPSLGRCDADLCHVNFTTQVGTILYASPEQYQGLPYSYETDIYSLGILMLEMGYIFKTEMERFTNILLLRNKGQISLTIPHKDIILRACSGQSQRPTSGFLKQYFSLGDSPALICRDIVWNIIASVPN